MNANVLPFLLPLRSSATSRSVVATIPTCTAGYILVCLVLLASTVLLYRPQLSTIEPPHVGKREARTPNCSVAQLEAWTYTQEGASCLSLKKSLSLSHIGFLWGARQTTVMSVYHDGGSKLNSVVGAVLYGAMKCYAAMPLGGPIRYTVQSGCSDGGKWRKKWWKLLLTHLSAAALAVVLR